MVLYWRIAIYHILKRNKCTYQNTVNQPTQKSFHGTSLQLRFPVIKIHPHPMIGFLELTQRETEKPEPKKTTIGCFFIRPNQKNQPFVKLA